MLAPQAPSNTNESSLKPPKQTKLLGATVRGVGVITSVSAELPWCFVLIENGTGKEHHAFVSDLKRDMLTMPSEPKPYHEVRRRVGVGLWSDMLELELVELSDLTHDLTADCLECGGEAFFVVAAGWAEESYKACEACGGTGKVDTQERAA